MIYNDCIEKKIILPSIVTQFCPLFIFYFSVFNNVKITVKMYDDDFTQTF